MTRIPLPQGDDLDPEQRRVHDAIASLRNGHIPSHYRAALHNPELSDKWQQLGELLRYRTSLPLRLSELAILVTAKYHRCDYEWVMHEDVARQAGLAEAVIASIKQGQRPNFSHREDAAIYDYCAELFETKFVSDAVYQRALDVIAARGIVELTALVGYYAMVAMSVSAHQLPLTAVKPKPRTQPAEPTA
jgi:4-carboxymuconolactone decarboxylase